MTSLTPAACGSVALIALLTPGTARAQFCLGAGCGAGEPGFHCHTRNALGVECWDRANNACEGVPGFSRAEALACDETLPALSVGGFGSQLPTAIGGFNVFLQQIRRPAVPRRARDEAEDGEAEEEPPEEDRGGAVHASEIRAFYEHERWKLFGVEGKTDGVRFGWRRDTDRGRLWGFSASYQEARPDSGEGLDLANASFSAGHRLGRSDWSWSLSGTWSDLSGFVDLTLWGASGQLYFHQSLEAGAVLSGGLIVQHQTAGGLDGAVRTLGYGLAYGLPLGQRFALDLEGYGVHVFEPELGDDNFHTLAASLSVYFSERLALTLGVRILEGVRGLESETLTVGTASRW